MLESALKFQKAFKRLGERDSEYAMMAGGIPKSEDWENARHFVKFFKIFYEVKETLFKVFDSYRLFGGNYQRSTRQDPPEIGTQELEAHETSFAMEFKKEMQFNESVNKNEIELYLMEALEKSGVQFDILNWWKVNSTKYPILGQIARDVLAMSVSTIALESAFSTRGRVLNNYRSSLTLMTAEALICTQNWLQNSLKLVLEELIEELEKLKLEVASTPNPNEEDSGVESD